MDNLNLGDLGGIFQDLQGQVDKVLEDYRKLEEQFKNLEVAYGQLRREKENLQSELDAKEQMISDIRGRVSGLMGKIVAFKQEPAE